MQKSDLKARLDKLEGEIQTIMKVKMKQKKDVQDVTRSSCPASCENFSKSAHPSESLSLLSRSVSAPSVVNARCRDVENALRKKDKKQKGRSRTPTRTSNTILHYIENLERSLHSDNNNNNNNTDSTMSKKASKREVLYQQKDETDENQERSKRIKKELSLLKHQLEDLEDSKREAIEITKRVIMKRGEQTQNHEEDQSLTTEETTTIKVCESSQTSQTDLLTELANKDALIKSLRDTNKSLYRSLKEQEEKNSHLLKSLQSSQAQLRENRKSFDKYENLLEENMVLSRRVKEAQDCVKKKDDTNRKILLAAEELAKDLHDRDQLNKQLNETVDNLKHTIIDLGEMNKKLLESHADLGETVKDKEQKYGEIKQKYDSVEKKIDTFKVQMHKSQLEITRLRQMVSNHGKQELSKEKDMENLQLELQEYKGREKELISEIKHLMTHVKELKEEQEKAESIADGEIRKLTLEMKKTKSTISELQEKMTDYEEKALSEKAQSRAVEELIALRQTMSENEILRREKDELKGLVHELTSLVKNQKDRILELSDFGKQQEQILEMQKQTLSAKESEIEDHRGDAKEARYRCAELESEVANLREKLKTLTESRMNDNSIAILAAKLQETTSLLNAERESVKIKDKMIDSLTMTVAELKHQINAKNEEIKTADAELNRLLRDFSRTSEESEKIRKQLTEERKVKEIMYGDIERLQQCKEDLLVKFNMLEKEFTDYYTNANANVKTGHVKDQEEMIESLQRQLKQQEVEWIRNSQLLLQEKEKAIEAAKFATQKLVDTVQDFQKQVDAHQQVQKMLTALLQEKDEKIRFTLDQMNDMTSRLTKLPFACLENGRGSGENFAAKLFSLENVSPALVNADKEPVKEMNNSKFGDCGLRQTEPLVMAQARSSTNIFEKPCSSKQNSLPQQKTQWSDVFELKKTLQAAIAVSPSTQIKENLETSFLPNSYANNYWHPEKQHSHKESHDRHMMEVHENVLDDDEDFEVYTDDEMKISGNHNQGTVDNINTLSSPISTTQNYLDYAGMPEIQEVFVCQHIEPRYKKNLLPGPTVTPVRYFSLLKKDKTVTSELN